MLNFTLAAMTVLFVLALLGAEALGRGLARRPDAESSGEGDGHDRVSHVLTSIFGLLALLTGFSFSIALDRYETRRADVVAEANAIGTADYRAGFLGEPGMQLRATLADYAVHRTRYGSAAEFAQQKVEQEAVVLRERIAVAGERLQPVANTPLGASTIASVNEVLDLGVQREANMRAKLPWTVFVLLISLSLIGAGMMGLAYPGGSWSRRGSSLLLFILLGLAINVIIDLDRPAGGGIAVEQKPMRDLAAALAAAQGEAPAADSKDPS